MLCNREALGLNLTENTCYLEWYFDGFARTFYANTAIVQLESVSSPPCLHLYTVIAESLQLKEWPYTARKYGPATLESVQPFSVRVGF